MSTPLPPAAAPAVAALESRLEDLLRHCNRLAAENRGLHLRAGELETALATARSQHLSDTDTLRRLSETTARERDERHAAVLAERDALHDAELAALRASFEAELAEQCERADAARTGLDAAHAETLAVLRRDADDEITHLRDQFAAARARVELMVARLRALDA